MISFFLLQVLNPKILETPQAPIPIKNIDLPDAKTVDKGEESTDDDNEDHNNKTIGAAEMTYDKLNTWKPRNKFMPANLEYEDVETAASKGAGGDATDIKVKGSSKSKEKSRKKKPTGFIQDYAEGEPTRMDPDAGDPGGISVRSPKDPHSAFDNQSKKPSGSSRDSDSAAEVQPAPGASPSVSYLEQRLEHLQHVQDTTQASLQNIESLLQNVVLQQPISSAVRSVSPPRHRAVSPIRQAYHSHSVGASGRNNNVEITPQGDLYPQAQQTPGPAYSRRTLNHWEGLNN